MTTYKIILLAATLLFVLSCKNLQSLASGQSDDKKSNIPMDRKQLIRSDKKKQAELDLPFRGFDYDKKITKIAVGSCANQDLPQPIWSTIDKNNPDLFIFAGDTVCSTPSLQKPLSQQYRKLNMTTEFRQVREKIPMLAIWNDFDFGMDDGGTENPDKESHRTEFIKNWSYLKTALPGEQRALYHAKIFGPKKQKVQIILLDTRWDRSPLKKATPVTITAVALPNTTSAPVAAAPNLTPPAAPNLASPAAPNLTPSAAPTAVTPPTDTVPAVKTASIPDLYLTDDDKSKHFLSEAQWNWLENELKKPAELRLVVSPIQVTANDHHFEKWGNFPQERERLFRLLAKQKAKNVIFISGDRQFASIARLEVKKMGSVYEMTASGLNRNVAPLDTVLTDMTYVNDTLTTPNFGLIKINWDARKVQLELHSADDVVKNTTEISF